MDVTKPDLPDVHLPGHRKFSSYKNALQEYCHKLKSPMPKYETIQKGNGYVGTVKFGMNVVSSTEIGKSAKEADARVAFDALKTLGYLKRVSFEFRNRKHNGTANTRADGIVKLGDSVVNGVTCNSVGNKHNNRNQTDGKTVAGSQSSSNESDKHDVGVSGKNGGDLDYNALRNLNGLDIDADMFTRIIYNEKSRVCVAISKSQMEQPFVLELLKIFAKVAKCSQRQLMLPVLALLQNSNLVLRHIPHQIDSLITGKKVKGKTEKRKRLFVESLLAIIDMYHSCFPGSFNDMPVDELEKLVSTIKDNESLKQQISE